MAAESNESAPGAVDAWRIKTRHALVLVGAVALVVVLVAVIANGSGSAPRMSDGSDGSADDPDLKEVASGIKIRDLKLGDGKECPEGATVKVNYTGWLTDGTVFDSTRDRGPLEYSLDPNSERGVIQGWQFGIPGMKPGGKRKLVISPDRGFQNRPQGRIPPGSTLIFEVELVSATSRM